MTIAQLLMTFTVGTALLALWSYLRWPGVAPTTMRGAIVRVLIAFALLQAGGAVIGVAVEALPMWAPLLFVATVVPILTYAFLTSLWFFRLCADQMR